MIDEIYNSRILAHAARIGRLGQLDEPDATARRHSRLCGSTVSVELKMKNGIVTDFAQQVSACALGQASASIMAQHIIGATAQELKALKKTMLAMLTEKAPPPTGKFAAFSCLEPARDYKARHGSIMLVLEAVTDCVEQIENSGK